MKSSSQIRSAFIDYFAERGHARLPSGPLVPPNDPTLMFANAGMVQFKDVFTGKESRDYKRAATSQKCIRISGKHNDLENVGFTARHHTFFEMLGNFSFGDYFKPDAIAFAWELVTERLGIDPGKLIVSIFGGEDGLEADEEAARLWTDVAKVSPERIKRCGKKDNFWQMGETGPCGPCSEIHYWTGDGAPIFEAFGEEPGPDGKGWVELWNLVFMQYERFADGRLVPLPAPSIDTGAGLERMSAVAQGVVSNYDTDLLRPIVDLASEISGKRYGGSLEPDDVSMRVIADHARTAAFLISEGVFPGPGAREYVLRRVMRRAIRHGHRLGIDRLFFHEAALKTVDIVGEVYPQLRERRALIEETAKVEEDRFRKTLARGLSLLEENEEWTEEAGRRVLPGAVAFKLYDTFGFPLDLQEVIGQEQGFAIDQAGFDASMNEARSRSEGSKTGDAAVDGVYHALASEIPAVEFIGYDQEQARSKIEAIIANGERVQALAPGSQAQIVTKATPFYGESGGQVGDKGVIRAGQSKFIVEDTQKPRDGLVVHVGRLEEGSLEVGAEVELEVDHALRSRTRKNHSATHLLHWALRTVLGPSAMQKGSLVGPDRLRFDYASSRGLSAEEIARVEDLVNSKILVNAPIETEVLPMDEAKRKGAIGIFEEKYGAVVRMLRMTEDSIELCGGTHASRTGDLGLFKIVSEGGLAAGVRRIEAQTGPGAMAYVRSLERELDEASGLLKSTKRGETRDRIEKLLDRNRELSREVEQLKKKLLSGNARDLTADAKDLDGVWVLGTEVDIDDPKALRDLADQLRDKHAPAVVLLGAKSGSKVVLVCTVSSEITGRFHAGNLVRRAAQIVGGGGGGRPDFAQAGGSAPEKLGEALQSVYQPL